MEKPSYYRSTLAQLACGAAVCFALGSLLTAIGVIWFKLDVNTAKAVMEPFAFLVATFASPYLATRKTGNSQPPQAEPKP